MGTYEFKLPDLAEGTTEGEVAAWYVAVGDLIQEEQPLVGVMTEKAVIDIPSPVTGTIVSLRGAVGDKVPVGAVLVVFRIQEAAPEDVSAPSAATAREHALSAEALPEPHPAVSSLVVEPSDQNSPPRPTASPAIRRRAREAGVALDQIQGSGPAGRVLDIDIDNALNGATGPPPPAGAPPVASHIADVEEIPIIGMRRKIAERMAQSKRTIPHFSYVEEIDVTELEALRGQLNSEHGHERAKLTPLPFIMRAIARTLPAYPDINATFDTQTNVLRRHRGIHIGIATQTPTGLLVPVVRDVQGRDLWDCAAELARLTAAARVGKASPHELAGSTITLTSLGALGGIAATPIINAPEVAIVGPNRIVERPDHDSEGDEPVVLV